MRKRGRKLLIVAALAPLLLLAPRPAAAVLPVATPGPDVLGLSNGDDTIDGLGGADEFYGRAGNDNITGGADDDRIFLGPGVDTATSLGDGDIVIDDDGTPADVINAGEGSDTIFSLDGASDIIDCGPDVDSVIGDKDDSFTNCEEIVVFPGEKSSLFLLPLIIGKTSGKKANDKLTIRKGGGWTVAGRAGNDRITGGGTNTLQVFPGAGKDVITVRSGTSVFDDDGQPDTVKGGPGFTGMLSADGAVDTISCGTDASLVFLTVDADDVLLNCVGASVNEIAYPS